MYMLPFCLIVFKSPYSRFSAMLRLVILVSEMTVRQVYIHQKILSQIRNEKNQLKRLKIKDKRKEARK